MKWQIDLLKKNSESVKCYASQQSSLFKGTNPKGEPGPLISKRDWGNYSKPHCRSSEGKWAIACDKETPERLLTVKITTSKGRWYDADNMEPSRVKQRRTPENTEVIECI